jgi:hypothetical protein
MIRSSPGGTLSSALPLLFLATRELELAGLLLCLRAASIPTIRMLICRKDQGR